MRVLRSAQHFSKIFYLREIIHDASIVTSCSRLGANSAATATAKAVIRQTDQEVESSPSASNC